MTGPPTRVTVCAGVPEKSMALFHKIRFSVGDPAALVTVEGLHGSATPMRILIVRDIEVDRAKRSARTDHVRCPGDFTPKGGLSGDRETATAQAVAECVRQSGATEVTVDRSTPAIYWHCLAAAGLTVSCDPAAGVDDRRAKDTAEIAALRQCQADTEAAVRFACELVSGASTNPEGVLLRDGKPLTSERLREALDVFLLRRGYDNPPSIVACGPQGSDCHERGSGELRTCEPVIIDVFPHSKKSLYHGDCTRTVVHGAVNGDLQRMHAAVVAAKAAAIAAIRPGVTGESIHLAASRVLKEAGFGMGIPRNDETWARAHMTHGTGHGVGLDVHEPPLLAEKGPVLVEGDVLTVEPGLYQPGLGGIRVEDMVVVTATGCDNFATLPEGLDWRSKK